VKLFSVPLRYLLLLLTCILTIPQTAYAHVGSKDVFEQVDAGPYKLYVTIRMPTVIPGVATVEVRSSGANVSGIHITPLPITGEAAKHPPTSDPMTRSAADPAFFTGSLWMMTSGSWEVRFQISGEAGEQTVSVPVPAVALSTLKMQRGLGIALGILGLFLVVSMAGIVAAAVRDARLEPGAMPSPSRRRRVLLATVISLIFMALLVWGGATWWNVEAASYSLDVYRPLKVDPVLSGNVLDLNVRAFHPDSERRGRSNNDFLPDHGHLMHLYAIREPEMDAVFHLHPELAARATSASRCQPCPQAITRCMAMSSTPLAFLRRLSLKLSFRQTCREAGRGLTMRRPIRSRFVKGSWVTRTGFPTAT
jgi:hypothetical protein